MPHRHELNAGGFTGPDKDLGNNMHDHPLPGGGSTSSNPYGEGHRHEGTGPPVEIPLRDGAVTNSIQGVEVFSVGTWNGDQYTIKDLESMVTAFDETKGKIKPFLKLGHDDKQKLLQKDGLPSAGRIDRLYIRNEKLLADFVDIPDKILTLIKNKAYTKVSSEIYWGIKIGQKIYNKFLAGIALLGANMPAVDNLSDILALYSREAIKAYTTDQNDLIVKLYTYPNDHEGDIEMPKTEAELKLEYELKTAKEKVTSFESEKKTLSKQIDDLKTKTDSLVKEKTATESELKKYRAEAKESKLDATVAEFQKEGICSKAMGPLVKDLLNPEKKEYTVKDEKVSAHGLLKEILTLAKEGAKVNFTEGSGESDNKSGDDVLDQKIKKYMKENKVGYEEAYRECGKKSA